MGCELGHVSGENQLFVTNRKTNELGVGCRRGKDPGTFLVSKNFKMKNLLYTMIVTTFKFYFLFLKRKMFIPYINFLINFI